jgi:Fur family peroxide stress response transcriptional regulator
MSQTSTKPICNTEQLELVCRQRGIPLTCQRRAVFVSIVDRRDHPTADQVFDQVRGRLKGVSRMTVYRALEWLVDLGAITKVGHPGSVIRFDPTTDRHHHLVCVRCNGLADLNSREFDNLELPATQRHGFLVEDYSVLFRGVCVECQRVGNPLGGKGEQDKKTTRHQGK